MGGLSACDPEIKRPSDEQPAAVMPLDSMMHPASHAFWAMTKDVSLSGLCLFTRLCITQPYLAIQLDRYGMDDLQFIIKIIRRDPVGMGYEIAGPVAAKLGDTYLPIEDELDFPIDFPGTFQGSV